MIDGLWEERRGFGHDLRVVASWLKSPEGRIARYALLLALFLIVAGWGALYVWDPSVWSEEQARRNAANPNPKGAAASLFMVALPLPAAVVWFMLAVYYKARSLRLERRFKISHAGQYRARLEREFNEERERWYLERDDWKARTQAQLYEAILDQVDRGELKPRPEYPGDSYDFPNSA